MKRALWRAPMPRADSSSPREFVFCLDATPLFYLLKHVAVRRIFDPTDRRFKLRKTIGRRSANLSLHRVKSTVC